VVEGRVLKVKGKIIDSVRTYLLCPFNWFVGAYPLESQDWLSKCRSFAEKEGSFYDGLELGDVWWRLLVCDLCRGSKGSQSKRAQEACGDFYLHPEVLL
jgi:hypothetical protein